jgi:hypothetical protein
MKTLLDYGANINGLPSGWNPLLAALHNGRCEAAEFLAVPACDWTLRAPPVSEGSM